MSTSDITAALGAYRAMAERERIAKEARGAVGDALVSQCPVKVGTIAPDFQGVPMYVERIAFRDCPAEWVLQGKRVKKDGTPHATASAYGWVRVEAQE